MDAASIFSQAQMSHLRPGEVTEMCKYLHLNQEHMEMAMTDLVGWDMKTIVHVRNTTTDPILEMFKELRCRDYCVGYCRAPDIHFDEKKCAALGVFYVRVQFCTGICRMLQKPDIQNRIINDVKEIAIQEGFTMELSYPLFTIVKNENFGLFKKIFSCFRSKENITEKVDVLLFDSFGDEAELQSAPALYNLLLNIEKNFTLFIASDIKDRDINLWKEYTSFQVRENADCVVILATQFMVDNYKCTSPEPNLAQERIRTLAGLVQESRKQVFAVTIDPDLVETVRAVITPLVFKIPEQLSFLLDMIKRVKKPSSA